MIKTFLFCLAFGFSMLSAQQQVDYDQKLIVVRSMEAYEASIRQDSNNLLVDIEEVIPSVYLDIRYATTNNFTGEIIYTQPKAFVRKPVAEALLQVQKSLAKINLGLVVYDAYRPYAATVKFYEVYHDTAFVASPYSGSRHNRGAAVDLSLVDLTTKKELEMPTGFDSFCDTAAPGFNQIPEIKKRNRNLLIQVMEKNGFCVNSNEWWHFDFENWQQFDLMDISFETLSLANNKNKKR